MFTIVFQQLMKMLVIMILAFICYKLKVFDQKANQILSNLLLIIVNPILSVIVYQRDYEPRLVRGLLISFALAAVLHIIGIVMSTLLIPSRGNSNYGPERFAAMYSNCGFMGIPLVQSILGNEGVFYLTAYMAVFNLFSWTHGLSLMTGKFTLKQIKHGLLSPVILGTCVGIILFFARIRFPEVIFDGLNYIADMNTPLAMMIAGLSIAQVNFKKMFANLHLYWVSLLKLFVFPVLTILFLAVLPLDETVAYTLLIAAACPVATTINMMAIRFDQDYKYCSELFAFTTVLAVVTIPAVIFISASLLN